MAAAIYVVDNSEDANEKKQLQTEFADDMHTRLIFPDQNLGFAAGVNLGLRSAIRDGYSKFILLNNDAQLLPHAGEHLTRALADHSGCLISPAIRWEDRVVKGNHYQKLLGLMMAQPCGPDVGWFYYFTACALAFDISVLETVGFFNEDYFMYGEDIEYCYRAGKNNIDLVLVDEKMVIHEGSHSAKKASFFYEYHINRGHFLLSKSMFPNSAEKILSLCLKAVVLFFRAVLRTVTYHSAAPLAGFLLSPIAIKIRPPR